MPHPEGGPRNPKNGARVQVRLAGSIEERILHVSDVMGQNIGVTASVCASIGLRVLEQLLFARETEAGQAAAAAMVSVQSEGLERDFEELGVLDEKAED